MKFLFRLFRKKQSEPAPAEEMKIPQKPEIKSTEPVYLTKTVTFGPRRTDPDSSIFFVDENRGIRRLIIDSQGHIQNFPGMIREDFWVKHVAPNYLKPQIRFRSSFEKRENGWIFLWQLQPDGWYWADEGGFGAENDLEVVLYSFLDLNGSFTGPFRIYQLGEHGYAMERFLGDHTRSQKRAMEAICDNEVPVVYPGDIFPQLLGGRTSHISEEFYQLKDQQETLAYWNDPVLSRDMKALAQAMLDSGKTLWQMMGNASGRVKASITLFWLVTEEPVFKQMLDRFYNGRPDEFTVMRLREEGMPIKLTLDRFRSAHADSYETALREIRNGRKVTHWMWYIFPQIRGLGYSAVAQYYEIQDKAEAIAYWNDPMLSHHMLEICQELLKREDSIDRIMGPPDNMKLRSCMTLFYLVTREPVFRDVLNKFFAGKLDDYTVNKL